MLLFFVFSPMWRSYRQRQYVESEVHRRFCRFVLLSLHFLRVFYVLCEGVESLELLLRLLLLLILFDKHFNKLPNLYISFATQIFRFGFFIIFNIISHKFLNADLVFTFLLIIINVEKKLCWLMVLWKLIHEKKVQKNRIYLKHKSFYRLFWSIWFVLAE